MGGQEQYYNSRWAIQGQPHHQGFNYVEHLRHYYKPLAALNIPVDILPADSDSLNNYRLVIAPALNIINEQRAEALSNYVKRGGRLVLTAR